MAEAPLSSDVLNSVDFTFCWNYLRKLKISLYFQNYFDFAQIKCIKISSDCYYIG